LNAEEQAMFDDSVAAVEELLAAAKKVAEAA
jgi:hypothetical protein